MLIVSEDWKNAHGELLLPETFVEINYQISDPGLQEKINFSVSQPEEYSELPDELKTGEKHGSLEWNAFGLDGSFGYIDPSPINPGYVTTSLCDAEARFSALPTITLTFDSIQTAAIPGFSIWWSTTFDEWASSFRIKVYNDSSIVDEILVEDNTTRHSTVWLDFQNFNKIEIEILEWSHPHHRCRTMLVFVGVEETYTKNELLQFTHTRNADLLSAALPKSEIVFGLDNSDDKWDPMNPTGLKRYLIERQRVTLRYGMTVNGVTEWMNGGTFWLSEWNTPSNGIEANFTARDAIQFMLEEQYTGVTSGTLYAIAVSALGQVSMDGEPVEYALDDNLKAMSTSFEGDYTISDVLQLVAHMGGCVLFCDVEGKVHIEPRNTELTDYTISNNVSFSYPEFTFSKPLKAVSVNYGDQVATVTAGTTGETQTVDNEFILTETDALRVANLTKDVLLNRKTISGEYRADPRLEALDIVTVQNKYEPSKVAITEVSFSTSGGALRGRYTGRVIDGE